MKPDLVGDRIHRARGSSFLHTDEKPHRLVSVSADEGTRAHSSAVVRSHRRYHQRRVSALRGGGVDQDAQRLSRAHEGLRLLRSLLVPNLGARPDRRKGPRPDRRTGLQPRYRVGCCNRPPCEDNLRARRGSCRGEKTPGPLNILRMTNRSRAPGEAYRPSFESLRDREGGSPNRYRRLRRACAHRDRGSPHRFGRN